MRASLSSRSERYVQSASAVPTTCTSTLAPLRHSDTSTAVLGFRMNISAPSGTPSLFLTYDSTLAYSLLFPFPKSRASLPKAAGVSIRRYNTALSVLPAGWSVTALQSRHKYCRVRDWCRHGPARFDAAPLVEEGTLFRRKLRHRLENYMLLILRATRIAQSCKCSGAYPDVPTRWVVILATHSHIK